MQEPIDTAFVEAQEQHRKLTTQVTRLEVEIETATKQVAQLEDEAIRLFGTKDLNKLRALLAERTAANESRKTAFVAAVNQLAQELAALREQANGGGN